MEVPITEFSKNPDAVRYLFDAGNEAVERGLAATNAGRIISLANQVAEQAPSLAESGQRMNLSPTPRGNSVPEQQRTR
jgi:hypothetical protein